MPANLVALGAVITLTGLVSWEAVREALKVRFPAGEACRVAWEAMQAGAALAHAAR